MRMILISFILFLSSIVFAAEIPNLFYVDNGIWRSGLLDKTNIDTLKTLGIKTIISMKTNPIQVEFEQNWSRKNKIKFIHIGMWLIPRVDEHKIWNVYERIISEPKPLLVHCTYGKDRTGVAVAMYRILEQDWSYQDTIGEMDSFGFSPFYDYWKGFLRGLSTH